jgi:Protein kinase domain
MSKATDLRAGRTFGRWLLVARLGNGGNGEVWKATDDNGQVGAIKFLQKRHLANPRRYSRFKHEVKALEACNDIGGVLPLWDYNLPDYPDAGLPWFVAPLANQADKALGMNPTIAEVVDACGCFANTLATMHSRGISHRDIKPANLFNYQSNWVIGDFGLVDFPDKTPVTEDGERLGPAHFIAPEMVTDADTADGALADVYSLAKTVWVLATRQRVPLPGPHRKDDPAYQIRSYIDERGAERLDVLLAAATVIDPKSRISMAHFGTELRSWQRPPVQRGEQGGDFSHLKELVRDLLLPGTEENTRREKIMRECEEGRNRIMDRLRASVQAIGEHLKTGGFPVGYQGPGILVNRAYSFFPDMGKHSLPDSNARRRDAFGAQAIVQNGESRHTLTAGIAVEYVWSEVPVFAVHAAYQIDPPGMIIWSDSGHFLLGGPNEDNMIVRLVNGLQKHIDFAVSKFLSDCLHVSGIDMPSEDHAG